MSKSRNAVVRGVLDAGWGPVLSKLGFAPSTNHRTWMRETGELQHAITLGYRHGSYSVEWGIVSPELVDAIWRVPYKPFDVGLAIVHGTPSHIRHPARAGSFTVDTLDGNLDDLASRLGEDAEVVAMWMAPFVTRVDLREFLLANREKNDSRRLFLVPSGLGLKLFVAAGLAIVDRDPLACGLLREAEQVMIGGEVRAERIASLRALAGGICD
jgi:hypothetical protein